MHYLGVKPEVLEQHPDLRKLLEVYFPNVVKLTQTSLSSLHTFSYFDTFIPPNIARNATYHGEGLLDRTILLNARSINSLCHFAVVSSLVINPILEEIGVPTTIEDWYNKLPPGIDFSFNSKASCLPLLNKTHCGIVYVNMGTTIFEPTNT